MVTYLDKILYLHPNINDVMQWHQKSSQHPLCAPEDDMKPWENPYDGIVWNNKTIPKPTQEELDAIPDEDVLASKEERRKRERDLKAIGNESLVATFLLVKERDPNLTFRAYLDYFEEKKQDLMNK